jgi:hypothetical protein
MVARLRAALKLRRNVVCEIAYQCRNIGYGIEADTIEGFWSGELDGWGKYTIRRTDGRPNVYLFADEILDVCEPVRA